MLDSIVLTQLPINTYGKIIDLHCDGSIRRRFLDLGMITGTKIKPVLKSPFGDPIAYEFRGNLIAIRKEDSDQIIVSLL